jgi:hypothetical protein
MSAGRGNLIPLLLEHDDEGRRGGRRGRVNMLADIPVTSYSPAQLGRKSLEVGGIEFQEARMSHEHAPRQNGRDLALSMLGAEV